MPIEPTHLSDAPDAQGPSDPRFRPAEPEHPMMLDGCMAPGDVMLMVRCMTEDLLMAGIDAHSLRAMTRDPEYQALFAARAALGDQAMDRLLDETSARIGVRRIRTVESVSTIAPATLTISARTPRPIC